MRTLVRMKSRRSFWDRGSSGWDIQFRKGEGTEETPRESKIPLYVYREVLWSTK
jgi:hypothetical protein